MRDRLWIFRRSPIVSIALAGWLAVGFASSAAAQDEAALTMRVESPGQPPMQMKFFIGSGGQLRMDMPQGASMIWTSGSMLMIQHDQKSYMEWGPEQMKMMQQMMQRMPQGAGRQGQPSLDPSRVRFRETGRREKIGNWDAFEVEMTGLPDGQTGALWMTRDLETGMLEMMARVGESLQTMPMFAAGGGPGPELTRYRELAAAGGIPQGQVVRIVATDKGQTTTMTLVGVEPGPLPAGTFAAPAGYSKMEMPMMPGR